MITAATVEAPNDATTVPATTTDRHGAYRQTDTEALSLLTRLADLPSGRHRGVPMRGAGRGHFSMNVPIFFPDGQKSPFLYIIFLTH